MESWRPHGKPQTLAQAPSVLRRTRHIGDRIGDVALHGLTAAAAAFAVLIIFGIVWKVVEGAWPAVQEFGISFVWTSAWNPNSVPAMFGAREFIIGTLVTSFGALLLAAPLSIAIGLFLSELAPPAIRGPIGTLVEMLAAVPSVVIGLWGIFVLGPFIRVHLGALPRRLLRLAPDLRRVRRGRRACSPRSSC